MIQDDTRKRSRKSKILGMGIIFFSQEWRMKNKMKIYLFWWYLFTLHKISYFYYSTAELWWHSIAYTAIVIEISLWAYCIYLLLLLLFLFNKCCLRTSVDTEMCCPKGKCGCQYFILFNLKKKKIMDKGVLDFLFNKKLLCCWH